MSEVNSVWETDFKGKIIYRQIDKTHRHILILKNERILTKLEQSSSSRWNLYFQMEDPSPSGDDGKIAIRTLAIF